MKFACERCGKRFTSVDEPAAGRVYRIRCRCGNVIQITASREAPPPPKGGMPLRSTPPLAGTAPRPATAAGDGGAPVRPSATSPRLPLASPPPERRAEPPRPADPAALHSHPQATPLSVLSPGAARRPPAERTPPPSTGSTSTSIPRPPPGPAPASPAPSPWGEQAPEVPVPADDPFAPVAAHAARMGNPFDITAPVEPPRKSPASPAAEPPTFRAPAGQPLDSAPRGEALFHPTEEAVWPEAPRPPGPTPARRPADEGETSVELAVSEQYSLPTRGRKTGGRGRLAAIAAAIVLVAGGGAGLYAWKLRGEATSIPARSATAPPNRPVSPPPPPAPPPQAAPPAAPPPATEAAAPPATASTEPPSSPARAAEPERRSERRERAESRREPAPSPPRRTRAEPKGGSEVTFEGSSSAPPQAADPAAGAVRGKEEAPPPKPPPALPDGLDPAVMQSVITRNRNQLERCVERALSDPATSAYAGRRVSLLVFVAPSGRAELALEDPTLDASPFGACLHRVASRMAFPPFRGEPVGARIPLQLGRAD